MSKSVLSTVVWVPRGTVPAWAEPAMWVMIGVVFVFIGYLAYRTWGDR